MNEEGARQRRPDAASKASDASDHCPCNRSDRRHDRTLSKAVTGRTGDIVHRHGNVFSVIGRDGRTTGHTRSSVRSYPERFQSGANMSGRVWSMMTGLGSESDLYARAQRSGGPKATEQGVTHIRSLAKS